MYTLTPILLGLTAAERWAAARQIEPRSGSQQWFVAIGVTLLLVLLVLLAVTSYRRHQQSKGREAKEFDATALRRGLTARERQILLALVGRSRLGRPRDIFHEREAFDRAAAQLLAECAYTRTPQEITELKGEIAALRQKVDIRRVVGGGGVARVRSSSREIPVGKFLELTGRRDGQAVALRVQVLRNDDIELAVALRTPLGSKRGDSWLARYFSGLAGWEFRTSTVRCDDQRLILSHSDDIHFVNRRRFPRVAVRWAALIAPLPFIRSDRAAGETETPHGEVEQPVAECAPTFVEGIVTEFAGPGLRIEAPLPVQAEDRVLVVFHWAPAPGGTGAGPRTVAGIGRVRHRRELAQGSSIAVELTGLSDTEAEDLVSLMDELSTRARGPREDRTAGPQETPAYVAATT
jgi:hypothetical protein